MKLNINQLRTIIKESIIRIENEKLISEATGDKELIVYHGSNHKIENFSTEFVGSEEAKDAKGPGIYFTSDKSDAGSYGKFLYTVRLTPKKILTDKSKRGFSTSDAVKLMKMRDGWEMLVQDWDENIQKGLNIYLREIFQSNNAVEPIMDIYGDYYLYQPKEFVKNTVLIGVDGINVTNMWGGGGSSEHYIIYNPNVIEILKVEDNI